MTYALQAKLEWVLYADTTCEASKAQFIQTTDWGKTEVTSQLSAVMWF